MIIQIGLLCVRWFVDEDDDGKEKDPYEEGRCGCFYRLLGLSADSTVKYQYTYSDRKIIFFSSLVVLHSCYILYFPRHNPCKYTR